jgi:hypothetical protein
MTTTKINIKDHLKEYLEAKFYDEEIKAVFFPDKLDIYHIIWDLVQKRPENCPIDKGNLNIALPDRRIGKSPETFNYISQRSEHIINNKIENMFYAELHNELDGAKHRDGYNFIDSVWRFICRYNIQSISEDALLKNYQRWRDSVRKKEKRAYRRQKYHRPSV